MSEFDGLSFELVLPELMMLGGLLVMILIPNMGDARMRLPSPQSGCRFCSAVPDSR